MNTVHVTCEKPYDVLIGRGLMKEAGERLKALLGAPCAVGMLTDDTVNALYGDCMEHSLKAAGFTVCRHAMPHGEANKNLAVWADMLSFLAENHLTRTDCVLALGGGVVGDMAGFAAASYLRGMRLVQVPTTLLAMVDSSVGGKTAVNLPVGKNLVGAFHQPSLVLCDPDALATLPPSTFSDGVGEVLKYGVLGDEALFALVASGDWHAQLEQVITRCVEMKAELVRQDEHDIGARQLLNLGHTLGHAIETCSHYGISHGHAITIGMVYAARLSAKLGLCEAAVTSTIVEAARANQLPTEAPFAADALTRVALGDKKRKGDAVTFVLPTRIGHCELCPTAVSDLSERVAAAVE